MRDSGKGQMDLLLLAVLEAAPAYGYVLIEEIRRRSDGLFELPESTVYPALHKLEGRHLVGSEWAEVNGRRRRVYTLTAAGRRALAGQREAWRRYAQAVSSVGDTP